MRVPKTKHQGPVEYMLDPNFRLTPQQFTKRCRAVNVADALQNVSEAIRLDRECETKVAEHLEIARTGLLDALAVLAEREGA